MVAVVVEKNRCEYDLLLVGIFSLSLRLRIRIHPFSVSLSFFSRINEFDFYCSFWFCCDLFMNENCFFDLNKILKTDGNSRIAHNGNYHSILPLSHLHLS